MLLVVEKFLHNNNKSQTGFTSNVNNKGRVKEQQFNCEVFYFNLNLMHNKKLYNVHASLRSAIIMTSSRNELS